MHEPSDERILRHVIATVSHLRAETYKVELLVSVPCKEAPEKLALAESVVNALRKRASVGATIALVSQDPEPEVIGHAAGPAAVEDAGYKIWYLEVFSEVRRRSEQSQEREV